ncbi:MAG: hypothetical protein HFJ80_04830 [Clostridiales bacterium]|nr:hypothetical protein [Clostridiales bacterium]
MPRRIILSLCLMLALSLALLALSGCRKPVAGEQKPAVTGFECDADVNYKDMNVKGHLKRRSEGTLTMEVTAPETLNGLTMAWDGETISIRLYGLSFGVNPEQVPESALGQKILDTLDAALGMKETAAAAGENGAARLEGDSGNGAFELYFDPATGALLELKLPDWGLDAKFSNFQPLNEDA